MILCSTNTFYGTLKGGFISLAYFSSLNLREESNSFLPSFSFSEAKDPMLS